MYNSIQLSTESFDGLKLLESFDDHGYSIDDINDDEKFSAILFSEAVFASGKETVKPLLDYIQKIKDELDNQIQAQEIGQIEKRDGKDVKVVKEFDPTKFWKNQLFKELENEISKIFGFRYVSINPYIEKYLSEEKVFESKIMNCEVYKSDRFPIDGLVTDKGFYDSTKSMVMNIYISLGLLKDLTAAEILAVFLHEFGHSIDPALTTIQYTEVNILSKYLTDRKTSLSKEEKKFLNKRKFNIFTYMANIANNIKFNIFDIFFGNKRTDKRLEKIRQMVENDKDKFNRQSNIEAFADNFARMYGYASPLMSGLKKCDKSMDDRLRSRFKREKARQKAILSITEETLKDVHKTNLHRIHALVKEYKNDLKDPNISNEVKSQLREDMKELEIILNSYMNDFDEFQNTVNKVIHEELSKINGYKEDNTITESAEENSNEDDIEKSDNSESKEFVPIFGIVKEYSLKKIRNDGTMKDKSELSSVKFHRIIKFLTRGDHYSHALVSFDSSLTKMYSYEDDGFVIDDIMTKESWMGTETIYLCVMFVNKEDRDRMKKFIDNLSEHAAETKYASANLLKAYVGKPYKADKRFVCSSFTGYIMSCANPKNLHRDWSRLRPEDITILPRAFYIMNVKDRDDFVNHKNEIDKIVNDIYEDHYDEIVDYNNQLPKIMLKDRIDQLKFSDKIWDWIIDRL